MLTLLAYKKRTSSDEPCQYVDIAAWQNELFAGEDAETGREYWRNPEYLSCHS